MTSHGQSHLLLLTGRLSVHPLSPRAHRRTTSCGMDTVALQASGIRTCGLHGVSLWRTELVKNSGGGV